MGQVFSSVPEEGYYSLFDLFFQHGRTSLDDPLLFFVVRRVAGSSPSFLSIAVPSFFSFFPGKVPPVVRVVFSFLSSLPGDRAQLSASLPRASFPPPSSVLRRRNYRIIATLFSYPISEEL